ncbi:MAG: four helix bundle protein [Chloroflexi bacterium]|nr:four helix bundle protein [Chloroflexota bacterium]
MDERKGLEGLLAWQRSMELAKRIYKEVIPLLPKEEKWAMGSQLRRAASSLPANIAEGYGRFYFQEGIRFSYIARGSLDLNYLPLELFESLRVGVFEIKRIVSGYIAYLKKSKPGQHEPEAKMSIRESRETYPITADEVDEIES